MKKLTLLFAFACLVCVCAQAKSVVFTLADGTKVYYLLGGETNPKLRFQEGKMLVEADTYEFSNIKNFYISSEDDPNAIENVLSKQNVRVGGNMVVINSSSVKNVDVFAANGAKVSAADSACFPQTNKNFFVAKLFQLLMSCRKSLHTTTTAQML